VVAAVERELPTHGLQIPLADTPLSELPPNCAGVGTRRQLDGCG